MSSSFPPLSTVLSPRLLFFLFDQPFLVSLVRTRVLLLVSLPNVRPLFFQSSMLVADSLCRLALRRALHASSVPSTSSRLALALVHSLRYLFVAWLLTELVGVLTGESLPWFVLHLLLRIFLPTDNNLDVQALDRGQLAQVCLVLSPVSQYVRLRALSFKPLVASTCSLVRPRCMIVFIVSFVLLLHTPPSLPHS